MLKIRVKIGLKKFGLKKKKNRNYPEFIAAGV